MFQFGSILFLLVVSKLHFMECRPNPSRPTQSKQNSDFFWNNQKAEPDPFEKYTKQLLNHGVKHGFSDSEDEERRALKAPITTTTSTRLASQITTMLNVSTEHDTMATNANTYTTEGANTTSTDLTTYLVTNFTEIPAKFVTESFQASTTEPDKIITANTIASTISSITTTTTMSTMTTIPTTAATISTTTKTTTTTATTTKATTTTTTPTTTTATTTTTTATTPTTTATTTTATTTTTTDTTATAKVSTTLATTTKATTTTATTTITTGTATTTTYTATTTKTTDTTSTAKVTTATTTITTATVTTTTTTTATTTATSTTTITTTTSKGTSIPISTSPSIITPTTKGSTANKIDTTTTTLGDLKRATSSIYLTKATKKIKFTIKNDDIAFNLNISAKMNDYEDVTTTTTPVKNSNRTSRISSDQTESTITITTTTTATTTASITSNTSSTTNKLALNLLNYTAYKSMAESTTTTKSLPIRKPVNARIWVQGRGDISSLLKMKNKEEVLRSTTENFRLQTDSKPRLKIRVSARVNGGANGIVGDDKSLHVMIICAIMAICAA